ncbi:MAG: hypothetical protein WBA51_04475 [Erythrobacter sp.]
MDDPFTDGPPRFGFATAGVPFLLTMLAIVLGGFAYLTYGPGLDNGYVGYGALFAIPFALGALVTGLGIVPFRVLGCLAAPTVLFAVIFLVVNLGFAEGLVCIAMVMPIWIVAGVGGGAAALWIKAHAEKAEVKGARFKVSAALTIPFALIYAEEASPPQWQVRSVERAVIIDAAARDVWPMLLAIPDITPDEGIATFTHDITGVPRPSTAALELRGDTLVRKANWGPDIRFEEHVTQIVPGRSVGWRFVFPDGSVQAHTDKHIDPDGPVLKIASGGYRIKEIAPGQSRLTLTTTYRMRTRLGWYFGRWGELMLGDVHDNVLAIIKDRAENREDFRPEP